jgi:hypothetical protein
VVNGERTGLLDGARAGDLMNTGRTGRRGRHPLPPEDRGETISCYLPRWAVARLVERADGVHLSRNMLVRHVLMEYLERSEGQHHAEGPSRPASEGGI